MTVPLRDSSNRADRIIRDRECREITGLSRTVRWRLERGGKFPAKIWLTANTCGYRLSDILDWLDERSRDSEAAASGTRWKSMAKARAAKRERAAAASPG